MSGLKHLSGAKEVSQDDFSAGVGTYIVTFDAPPAATVADVLGYQSGSPPKIER